MAAQTATLIHYNPSGNGGDALPTPPHSPPIDPMNTAIHLLDSLQAFYHRERTWVLHTRAAFEERLLKGPEIPALVNESSMSDGSPASDYSSSSMSSTMSSQQPFVSEHMHYTTENTAPAPITTTTVVVKSEPFEPSMPKRNARDHSRWMRRKNSMKLKLEGIGPKNRRRLVRATRAQQQQEVSEPGARLLEMFGDLVDARMESCQRITRLIRTANDVDVYSR